MQAKYAVVAALALSGAAAWAQTLPAEAWVGPPIPTQAALLDRGAVVADTQRALSTAHAPQEAWVGPSSDLALQAGAVSRQEVVADLTLFGRAGLLNAQGSEGFDPSSAANRQRLQVYMNLRNGPAYPREIARLEGREVQPTAAAVSAD